MLGTVIIVPNDRTLQPEGRHHSRGIAASGFPPHCAISPTAASRRSLGRVSVPMWAVHLSVRLRSSTWWAVTRQLSNRDASPSFSGLLLWYLSHVRKIHHAVLAFVSKRYPPSERQVPHVLLTRPPLRMKASFHSPFDLHVLGVPPAFVPEPGSNS